MTPQSLAEAIENLKGPSQRAGKRARQSYVHYKQQERRELPDADWCLAVMSRLNNSVAIESALRELDDQSVPLTTDAIRHYAGMLKIAHMRFQHVRWDLYRQLRLYHVVDGSFFKKHADGHAIIYCKHCR